MELHKLGVKVFAEDADTLNLLDLIPVFHRWIQARSLDGMLIDVADYSHVHAGPGILLLAHEGNYGFDEAGHQRGMVYYSKQPIEGSLTERLIAVCQRTLHACRLLEQESTPQGVNFLGNQLQLFANDRLLALNSDETYTVIEPALGELLDKLYPDMDYQLEREADPKERFAITVKSSTPVSVTTLLERLN